MDILFDEVLCRAELLDIGSLSLGTELSFCNTIYVQCTSPLACVWHAGTAVVLLGACVPVALGAGVAVAVAECILDSYKCLAAVSSPTQPTPGTEKSIAHASSAKY